MFAPRGMAWRTENRIFPLNICSSHIHQHRPKRPLSELTSVVRIELYSKFESCLTALENGSISPGAQSNWIMLDKLNFMVLHPREAPRGLSFARKPAEKIHIYDYLGTILKWVSGEQRRGALHTYTYQVHTYANTENKQQTTRSEAIGENLIAVFFFQNKEERFEFAVGTIHKDRESKIVFFIFPCYTWFMGGSFKGLLINIQISLKNCN